MQNLERRLAELESRVTNLERLRRIDMNARIQMLRRVCSYLKSADLHGDYCEFGVGEGQTFCYAARVMGHRYPDMRFWGFDTFCGMPAAEGADAHVPFNIGAAEGAFSPKESAQAIRRQALAGAPRVDSSRIITVEGLFADTLRENGNLPTNITVAFVDPIHYEPTKIVLDFITGKLRVGSVLIFDDWFSMRNSPQYGNQRACREWIETTGHKISPMFSYAGTGRVFSVQECAGDSGAAL